MGIDPHVAISLEKTIARLKKEAEAAGATRETLASVGDGIARGATVSVGIGLKGHLPSVHLAHLPCV